MAEVQQRVILYAGGGTGGHIFPNMAIAQAAQRLSEETGSVTASHFLISNRPLDETILQSANLPFTVTKAVPLALRPMKLMKFIDGYWQSRKTVRRLIEQLRAEMGDVPIVMVTTGGFVSGPAVAAAKSMRVPTAMVNLDAVAGKANLMLAHQVDIVFTCYPSAELPAGRDKSNDRGAAEVVSYPVRAAARAIEPPQVARERMGLKPDLPTLLVTAGSQGALTINKMMRQLIAGPRGRASLDGWQVLHLSGKTMVDELQDGYKDANIHAVVKPFVDEMGLAWAAATLAISRSGAGSVGEAWCNAVPCIFLPYPFHLDNHQVANAKPLTDRGAAVMCRDLKDADKNVHQLLPILSDLTRNEIRVERMRQMLLQSKPQDGSRRIAKWALTGE